MCLYSNHDSESAEVEFLTLTLLFVHIVPNKKNYESTDFEE